MDFPSCSFPFLLFSHSLLESPFSPPPSTPPSVSFREGKASHVYLADMAYQISVTLGKSSPIRAEQGDQQEEKGPKSSQKSQNTPTPTVRSPPRPKQQANNPNMDAQDLGQTHGGSSVIAASVAVSPHESCLVDFGGLCRLCSSGFLFLWLPRFLFPLFLGVP